MKSLRQQLILLCALFFVFLTTHAQNTPQHDLSLHRGALRYFSGVELKAMEIENPSHYAALQYYFTNSFTVETIGCENCPLDYDAFYNYHLFNVQEHEAQRLSEEAYTFVYRDQFLISLHPHTQVLGEMGMPIDQVLKKDLRPLPVYVETGNPDQDYAQYRLEMKRWIRDFPEEYRAITARSGVLHIPYLEFLSLSNDRKNDLNTRPNAYLLID